MPQLTAALAGGELPFSAIRELTRVATPATEASWVAAASGKNLRQIEELVADHRPGDRPDDPPDPQARTHVVRLELSAQTFALLRQARTAADDEHGTNLPDDAFIAALCNAVLDDGPRGEVTGHARFQIAMTVCARCRHGWQEGAGAQGPEPERAYQDIPPSVARLVWRRDGGRCRVPGCRSSRGLELHHLIHRADGGTHDALNLALVCAACHQSHQSHHDGRLTISGPADRIEVRRPGKADPESDPLYPTASSSVGAHVSATEVVTSTCAGAHVDGPNAATSVASTGAPAGATSATTPVADEDAHVDAPSATISVASTGAAMGAADVTTPVADRDAPMGTASVTSVPGSAHVGAASKLDATILRTQAKAALIGLGWKPAIAHAAVLATVAAQGAEVTLERLIFESLRRCPVPKT